MGNAITGAPPKPYGFSDWQDYASALADFLELQGSALADLALTGLTAVPTVVGFQQIVGLAAATALTVPAGATAAFIQIEGQPARWRDDGTNPSTTVGMLITPGDPILMYAGDFTNLRFIQTAASSTLNIEYRR